MARRRRPKPQDPQKPWRPRRQRRKRARPCGRRRSRRQRARLPPHVLARPSAAHRPTFRARGLTMTGCCPIPSSCRWARVRRRTRRPASRPSRAHPSPRPSAMSRRSPT
ncbi:MAG: hypothetical protein EPN38_05690 [Rhodanobacteraceae bacterium]|nr:MAG: hypothetical protein EPN38_05690 [Rhodanobacteraceae bacterium]